MRSPLAQASRILLHFDIAAVPSKLSGDRSLRDQLQICEPPFVNSIAPRSRELLASRREVLQTLTSCRYSPSLAAVGLCRKSTYVFGPSGRRSASLTKTHVGVRQANCGAWEVLPGKKLFIRWPAGEPLPRYDKNLLRKMKMVPLPVGAWPKMPIRCAQIFGETAVSLMNFLLC